MDEIKKDDKIKITGFNSFKDNLFRRLIGKLFPSFDRTTSLNGEFIISEVYKSGQEEPLKKE